MIIYREFRKKKPTSVRERLTFENAVTCHASKTNKRTITD
ncbi:hypothetical protein T12_4730 [Trichinella patagoniensis]|uniref:Uncharacterized protein n=1 Tax=Trichinella patagoniensis TaxID=990121 RepID=A0A0V0V7Z6_9BILA|nr:hypothetical protein T12_4730 [Trichinella patagoniensis]